MLIFGFDEAYNNIAASYLKVRDESMSGIHFWKTVKGNLPHLSCIFCKPEPLGKYFKAVACSVTGALVLIEIQRLKEGIKHSKYQNNIGEISACTKIITEAENWISRRYRKGSKKL